jgi:DNA-binding CsgD family transcriptional regulator
LVVVPELGRGDAERLLRFVAEAESLDGDEPFSGDLLVELGKLVHADWVTYNELDRVRRRNLLAVARPGDPADDENEEVLALFWPFVIEAHPVCLRHQQGYFGALKLSDFLTQRQLRATRLYNDWLRPLEVEYELNVAIPSPLWHTKTFLFDRRGGRDFSERDRVILNQLQPHLTRLWRAAKTRRLLRAALAELDRPDEHESQGVILLGAAGEIEFASRPAHRLLHEFFPPAPAGALPALLADWLESGSARPLVRQVDRRRLTVERSGDSLFLEEKRQEIRLTAREREVLAWVARGKTNAEIAQLLWLAPSTVRKHLENVYAKLGVSTRTAAVVRFLGLLDAEAS